MMQKPAQIPWPLTSFPGTNPQEGAGRLINAYAVPIEEPGRPTGPARQKWVGSPGLLQHAATGQSGYRGGLLVKNLSYEIFKDTATTVDVAGTLNVLGSFPGSKLVSIARDQAATPNVVAVDVDNGAYTLSTGGAPSSYNGGGNLPQPNSVCNQDGYFFFTIADGRVFATALNSLGTINALTFITCQAKADVTLLRGIPFSSLLLLFTTGSCEIWQDGANPAPNFPYNRVTVIEFGLVQPSAIAGNETGFSELIWAAQDHGVYWLSPGSLAPVKVSPPDLDKLIEDAVQSGKLLDAGCYVGGGKKFWHISSPDWSWEFALSTRKWTERVSYKAGQYVRWRAVGGHPAFNRWLMGDQQSGNVLYPDDDTFAENGSPMLFRMESGPTRDFPEQTRIARADFDFVFGTGLVEGNYMMTVTGAASGTGGVVRLTVNQTVLATTGDEVQVAGVTGTTEANGTFACTVVDGTHIELQGTVFANAYVSGGTVTDISVTANAAAPQVAISCSTNGGFSFDTPSIRPLQPQRKNRRARATVKNRGQSTAPGVRWRIDITDPVYRSFLGGTMSNNPREVQP